MVSCQTSGWGILSNKALFENGRSTIIGATRDKGDKDPPNILVTTYNPGFLGLKKVVSKKWDLLGKSCTTRSIHRVPLLAAFRRSTNLKDILVRAKVRQPEPQREPNTNVCLHPNTCRYCPKLNTDGRVLCLASGRTII